ncbi:hypothetical protein ACWEN3_07910 [Streptomyces sp. NPDC004561]
MSSPAGEDLAEHYGLDFSHLPELHWRYDYPCAVAVMALGAGLLYRAFRRKGGCNNEPAFRTGRLLSTTPIHRVRALTWKRRPYETFPG